MKKGPKPRKPELRVYIATDVMRALKIAIARTDVSLAQAVEHALRADPAVKREMENV